jgi:hypothetical protein
VYVYRGLLYKPDSSTGRLIQRMDFIPVQLVSSADIPLNTAASRSTGRERLVEDPYSGAFCPAVRYKFIDISADITASIFMFKE